MSRGSTGVTSALALCVLIVSVACNAVPARSSTEAAGTTVPPSQPVTSDIVTTTLAPATSAPALATTSTTRPGSGSGRPVTFAFAGETQFPDVLDTEPGSISSGTLLSEQLKANPDSVMAPVKEVLSGADVAMVNLETAITERGTPVSYKAFHFRSPPQTFQAMKAAGIDLVNMGNNHSLDYGPVGMQDTFDALAASKFPVVGIGQNAADAYRPYRTEINGQRIAIFGALDHRVEPQLFTPWAATETQAGVAMATDGTRLLDAVRAARPTTDTLVVFLHWGTETTHCGSPDQQEVAAKLVAAGADIVVGSHAHRVFGAGRLGDAFVAYGLGNFTYWREDDESGRSGILLVQATGRHVDTFSWVPARITHGIPIPETGSAAAASLAEWEQRRTCSGLAP